MRTLYFSKKIDELLGGIEGVLVFMDDILVATPDVESHFIVLERVFQVLKNYNLKLVMKKVNFSLKKSNF